MLKLSLALAALSLAACGESTPLGPDASASATDGASVVPADGMQASLEHCTANNCGGELQGRWVFDQACSEKVRPEPVDDCGTQLFSKKWLSGEIAFSADGTAEVRTQIINESYLWIPKRCRPLLNSCENAVQYTPPVVGSCVEVDGFCDCVGGSPQPESTASLPYRAEGGQFVITTDEGESAFGYCTGPGGLRYTSESGEVVTAHRVE